MKKTKIFLTISLALFNVNMHAMEGKLPPSYQVDPPSYAQAMSQSFHNVVRFPINRLSISPVIRLDIEESPLAIIVRPPSYGQVQRMQLLAAPAVENMQEGLAQENEQEVQMAALNNARHATVGARLKTLYKERVCNRCLCYSCLCCLPPLCVYPNFIGYICCNNGNDFNKLVDCFFAVIENRKMYDGSQTDF